MRAHLGRVVNDRYRLESVIAEKHQRAVYRAQDLRMGRPVAVKAFATSYAEELRSSFRFEAATLARLHHHPNVVTLYDYGTDPELGLDFYIMELLAGRNLREWMRRAPDLLTTREVIQILREAARGLAVVHRTGFVHCAVRPSHLLLVKEAHAWTVKLLGFGAVREQHSDAMPPLSRNPSYESPEQKLGSQAVLTPATDVFSLALTSMKMLTGKCPDWLNSEDVYETPECTLMRLTQELKGVPPWLVDILQRSLHIDPEDRFVDASELCAALDMRGLHLHFQQNKEVGIATRQGSTSPAGVVAYEPSQSPAPSSHSTPNNQQILVFMTGSGAGRDDIIELKPNIWGFGINLRALIRSLHAWWTVRRE
jgi:serine/threonine protein kinase